MTWLLVDGDGAVCGVVKFPVGGDCLVVGLLVGLEEFVGFAKGVVACELLLGECFGEAERFAVVCEGVVVVVEVFEGSVAGVA